MNEHAPKAEKPLHPLHASQPARTLPLRAQVAFLLAFATLPVGVLAVAQGYKSYNDTLELRNSALAADAIEASLEERGAIKEAFGALSVLDSNYDPSQSVDACKGMVQRYVASSGKASFAGFVNREGLMECGYPLKEPLDLRSAPEFERFIENPRRTVTAYAKGAVTEKPVLVVSAPVERNDRLVGSVAISLSSSYLNWVSRQENSADARFAIVGSNGARVAGTDVSQGMEWLPTKNDLTVLLENPEPSTVMASISGDERIYAVTPLFGTDVFSISSWPQDRITGGNTWQQILSILLPLFMWAFAVMVAYYAVDRFALRHVVYLDRLLTDYTYTRQSLRAVGVRDAPFEFAKLGASFDGMAETIENREKALENSIDEKDVLLKEVYHRVKNNLQMISSLINLQIRGSNDKEENEGLLRLQERVHGLAAVHQRLSEAGSLSAVRIDTLIEHIVDNTRSGRDNIRPSPAVTFDMINHTEGPDRAVPLSLFVTEAVANVFKHAMNCEHSPWLRIKLSKKDSTLCLEIENSFVPAPDSNKPKRVGLGSKLIEGFASQLRGTLEREHDTNRFLLRLTFPDAEMCHAGETADKPQQT